MNTLLFEIFHLALRNLLSNSQKGLQNIFVQSFRFSTQLLAFTENFKFYVHSLSSVVEFTLAKELFFLLILCQRNPLFNIFATCPRSFVITHFLEYPRYMRTSQQLWFCNHPRLKGIEIFSYLNWKPHWSRDCKLCQHVAITFKKCKV